MITKWTIVFQGTWIARIRDSRFHPTPLHVSCWGTTLTESTLLCILVVHPKTGIGYVVTRGCGGWQIVSYIFLPLTHPHLGCLETPPSTLFWMLPFFPVFTEGTPYLGDPQRSKWHFVWRAHPKKLHLQRTSLHLGRFYLLNVIWHCGRPSKIQGDRKLHIGRYQFSRFRENATSFSKHTLTQNINNKTQSVDSTW